MVYFSCFTIKQKVSNVLALWQSRAVNNFNVLMVLVGLGFLIQPVYSSGERSHGISLDNSGNPLNIVNVCRGSPNFCNLSGYLAPPTWLPLIAGSQMLARAIISLYYSYYRTYIINLNSIWSPCLYFNPNLWDQKRQLYHCAVLHWQELVYLCNFECWLDGKINFTL